MLAVFAVVAVYHFRGLGHLNDGGGVTLEQLKHSGLRDDEAKSQTKSTPLADGSEKGLNIVTSKPITKDRPHDPGDTLEPLDQGPHLPPKSAASSDQPDDDAESSTTSDTSTAQAETEGESKPPLNVTEHNAEPATVAQSLSEPVIEDIPDVRGQGRLEIVPADNGSPKIHWTQLPEHFPVPTESLIPLPTGQVKKTASIQLENFPNETPEEKAGRESKLDSIKKTFAFSWDGYRKNAWMQDELSPVSGNYRNPFCGWAATLVDSLDSLWMFGMKEEFEEAVEAVGKIDFTTSIRNDIPLFEVTIRYLGGLIAAYDISGSEYRGLLDKAVELAEILMGAFDTPNRMPMTFYLWKPSVRKLQP